MTPGGLYVWGIDLAASNLAFAFAPINGGPCTVQTLITKNDRTHTDGARYGLIDRQVRIAARQYTGNYPPATVWLEQPSGAIRNLTLTYTAGCVLAALAETVPAPVWTIPSGTWKKRVLGYGNASKPQVHAWVKERYPDDDMSQDEADAVCIALAGRAMTITGQWEATAA